MNETILVVDDEPGIRIAVERLLAGCGYGVVTSASGEEALRRLEKERFGLVITDLTLEPVSGLELLAQIQRRALDGELPADAAPPVIVITAYGSERSAVEAMKQGAVDYLPKPFDNDELVMAVRRVLEEQRLRRELDHLREEVGERYGFHQLVGRSPAMRRVFERIRRVADTDLTVLIRGPSGTGKELVANAIHYNSSRRNRPMVKVNCAAFSRELVESELFGHEQGAFTGATRSRQGKFELADGGTLFLDEIGDMSPETQAKVLRVLQERCFERVGGNRTIRVDVRILAATNQDLEARIEKGEMRHDLFYRLNVVPVELPSLAERPEDLTLLIDHFLAKASERLGRPPKKLSAKAARALVGHRWEGNVRELEHAVEHAVALGGEGEIGIGDLPPSVVGGGGAAGSSWSGPGIPGLHTLRDLELKEAKRRMVDAFEREFIGDALRRHCGNVTHTARALGIYRQQLQAKLGKLGLDPSGFRAAAEPGTAEE